MNPCHPVSRKIYEHIHLTLIQPPVPLQPEKELQKRSNPVLGMVLSAAPGSRIEKGNPKARSQPKSGGLNSQSPD
jgi:hypothetical protein